MERDSGQLGPRGPLDDGPSIPLQELMADLGQELGSDVEDLFRVVQEDPIPEANADLVSRTLRRVRGMLLLRDLIGLATLETVWDSLTRRRHRERDGAGRRDGPA